MEISRSELQEQIRNQGEKVRQLKINKATKQQVRMPAHRYVLVNEASHFVP
jgi:hypothetical protein